MVVRSFCRIFLVGLPRLDLDERYEHWDLNAIHDRKIFYQTLALRLFYEEKDAQLEELVLVTEKQKDTLGYL